MPEHTIHPLPRTPECGGRARRLLDREYVGRVPPPTLDNARTVVTELANNAYLHGEGHIELRTSLHDGRLRVEVIDQGQGAATVVREAGTHGGGNGLRLVDMLSADWGSFEGTTHVWAEFRIDK